MGWMWGRYLPDQFRQNGLISSNLLQEMIVFGFIEYISQRSLQLFHCDIPSSIPFPKIIHLQHIVMPSILKRAYFSFEIDSWSSVLLARIFSARRRSLHDKVARLDGAGTVPYALRMRPFGRVDCPPEMLGRGIGGGNGVGIAIREMESESLASVRVLALSGRGSDCGWCCWCWCWRWWFCDRGTRSSSTGLCLSWFCSGFWRWFTAWDFL